MKNFIRNLFKDKYYLIQSYHTIDKKTSYWVEKNGNMITSSYGDEEHARKYYDRLVSGTPFRMSKVIEEATV